MTTSLGKRSSTNGISDIAYKDEKAPVYTSTDQFVQGTKTFNAPIKFLSNVLCSGSYYGDGSHLVNLPGDPTKVPLAGGTMTGALIMNNALIKSQGVNGEVQLGSDTLSVHPGQGVRSQLAATSLDFNNDGLDFYVAVGTNTMIGNVPGLLAVNGTTGASAAIGIDPIAPNGCLCQISDTVTVNKAVADKTSIEQTVTGEAVEFTLTDLKYKPPAGAFTSKTWNDIIAGNPIPDIDQVLTAGNVSYDKTAQFIETGSGPSVAVSVTYQPSNFTTYMNYDGIYIQDTGGQTTYYKNNEFRIQNSGIIYRYVNDNRFMKWDCGTSFRVDVDDPNIRVDQSFKCSRNGMAFDFEEHTSYLDDQGNAGWSVQLSNQSGSDIDVNNPDIKFYYHPAGYSSGTIQLKKYATARFTLVPAPNETYFPPFAWAVSMY